MSTLLKSAFIAASIALSGSAAAGIVTDDFGAYAVTYDDASVLGGISFSGSGSGGSVTFGWTLPESLLASGDTLDFALPSFTVTVNPGYTLSGALAGFIGNLSFVEFGEDETGAWISGSVAFDGAGSDAFYSVLDRTVLVDTGPVTSGYYSLSGSAPFGSFSSVTVSDLVLTLSAGGNAAVFSTNQGVLEIGFVAVPVPEAETYAMLLAGLGLVSMVARRRMSR